MKNNIGYLLLIGFMFTLLGCGTAIATKETLDPASSIKVTPQAPLSSKNEPDMSMSEFEEIKSGMTYEQTTAIVGTPGEIIVETGTPGDPFYTVTYQFKGQKEFLQMFSSDAYAQLTFQGGKLITKSQMRIKKSTYEKISK